MQPFISTTWEALKVVYDRDHSNGKGLLINRTRYSLFLERKIRSLLVHSKRDVLLRVVYAHFYRRIRCQMNPKMSRAQWLKAVC